MTDPRTAFRERIARNIEAHGVHLTLVTASTTPRFVYTIGRFERGLPELVLAGAGRLSDREAAVLLDACARTTASEPGHLRLHPDRSVTLTHADPSWLPVLTRGIPDIYGKDGPLLQLVPSSPRTLDTPDLALAYDPSHPQPGWRHVAADGPLLAPESAEVVTHLAVLEGQAATEVGRWEEGYWEVFAGPGDQVAEADVRTLPMEVLIDLDPSLLAALELAPGTAMWRSSGDSTWEPWGRDQTGQ